MFADAQYWIRKLNMQPHPEGGFYKQTYQSEGMISALNRRYATAIYFLLHDEQFSAFHRIQSDELWHFYTGSPLEVLVLHDSGELQTLQLGPHPEDGEQFQAVVPAGKWFASRLVQSQSYALLGCTVSPGFDFRDFEMADRQHLVQQFPQHEVLITSLTRST